MRVRTLACTDTLARGVREIGAAAMVVQHQFEDEKSAYLELQSL